MRKVLAILAKLFLVAGAIVTVVLFPYLFGVIIAAIVFAFLVPCIVKRVKSWDSEPGRINQKHAPLLSISNFAEGAVRHLLQNFLRLTLSLRKSV
jgi:hypothetical protein